MKYLLLVCATEELDLTPDEEAELGRATDDWVRRMRARGVRLRGHQLHPSDQARTVRVRSQEVVVTTGPFAEAGEQMAGFDLLECADIDEAVDVASQHPMARLGTVEVRPMMEDE